jgi:hypothetical protein
MGAATRARASMSERLLDVIEGRCIARHRVFATPNPAGANSGCAMKVARHSPSAMGQRGLQAPS